MIPEGTNLYAYVGNDPINFVDPLGFCRSSNNSSSSGGASPPTQNSGSGTGNGGPPKKTASSASPDSGGGNFGNNALKKFGNRSLDDLAKAASEPFKKSGLTKAARALDKHASGQRASGTFQKLSGNAAARNKQAQEIVKNILNNSKSRFKNLDRGGLEVRSPSGQGIRFNRDGTFSGFID